MVSFTTTTIVNRRMHANIIRVRVLDLVYRALKWLVNEDIIGWVMFSAWVIIIRDIIEIIAEDVISFIERVWFGTIATKYENMTSIPPM